MIIFVFIKDPEIAFEIIEQHLHKMRLNTERQRKLIEDLEKEIEERLSQTQGNSTDAAIS